MVAVADDQVSDVLDDEVLEGGVSDVLPSGRLLPDHQTELVAGVEEGLCLRIVRAADDVAVEVLADDLGVAAHDARGHGVAGVGEELVAVESEEMEAFAVEEETVDGEASVAETDAGVVVVERFAAGVEGGDDVVAVSYTHLRAHETGR